MKFCRFLFPLLLPILPLRAAQTDIGSAEAGLLNGRLEKQLAEISALDAEIQSLSQRLGREGTPLPRRAPERPLPPPEPVPVQPVGPTPPVEPPVVPPENSPSVRPAIPVPENGSPTHSPPIVPDAPPPVAVVPPPVIPPPPVETVPVAVAPPAPTPTTPPPALPVPEPPAPPIAVITPSPVPVDPPTVGGGEISPPIPTSSGGDYIVVAGDTLSAIARKHNMTLAALQKANPDVLPAKLKLGQKLVIPGRGTPLPDAETPAIPSVPVVSGPLVYTVQPGDTLHGIARRAGTSVESLSQENGITNPESLKIGQKLRLPDGAKVPAALTADPSASPSRPPTPGTHVVKPGDTLSSISRETGTPLEELRKVNNLKDDTIHPGQSLKVRRGSPAPTTPRGDSGASVAPPRPTDRAVMVAATAPQAKATGQLAKATGNLAQATGNLAQATEMAEYTVKSGDSIFSIARRYFMSRDELASMNQLPVDAPLQAGQKLRLPANLVAGARMAESESLAR